MWVLVLFGMLLAIGLRREGTGSSDSALALMVTVMVLGYVALRGHLL